MSYRNEKDQQRDREKALERLDQITSEFLRADIDHQHFTRHDIESAFRLPNGEREPTNKPPPIIINYRHHEKESLQEGLTGCAIVALWMMGAILVLGMLSRFILLLTGG
jgi:hypothetical protein